MNFKLSKNTHVYAMQYIVYVRKKYTYFPFPFFFCNDNALKKSDLISLFIFTSKLVIALSPMFYDELP